MLNKLLITLAKRFVREGTLTLTLPGRAPQSFGQGSPRVGIAIKDSATIRAILMNPELGLGEAYMDERLTLTEGDLFDFFHLLARNRELGHLPGWQSAMWAMRKRLKRFAQKAHITTSRQNVAHHYDISTEFYDLFLSEDRMYTCAYYEGENTTLPQAQHAKIDHIAGKLLLEPGLRLLDIGCGWGYMACYLAKKYDVHVTGVSLSREQLKSCAQFAKDMEVEDRVDFRYQDYREVDEQFDRIYSVGMLEHVGQPQYATYFEKIHENLSDDGIALIHFIGRNAPPGALSPWFNKYIFPGGYTPALSEVTPAVEASGLLANDLEIWRGHYERTLYDWWERFEANIAPARAMYDDRFIRMWRYYLVAAQVAFPEMKSILCHLQLSKNQYRVPNKRDYLYVDGAPAPEAWATLPPPLQRLTPRPANPGR